MKSRYHEEARDRIDNSHWHFQFPSDGVIAKLPKLSLSDFKEKLSKVPLLSLSLSLSLSLPPSLFSSLLFFSLLFLNPSEYHPNLQCVQKSLHLHHEVCVEKERRKNPDREEENRERGRISGMLCVSVCVCVCDSIVRPESESVCLYKFNVDGQSASIVKVPSPTLSDSLSLLSFTSCSLFFSLFALLLSSLTFILSFLSLSLSLSVSLSLFPLTCLCSVQIRFASQRMRARCGPHRR